MSEDQGWFSNEVSTFGDRLAGAREAAGMDQAGLAAKLGVRRNLIEAWENDIKEPRANRLQMMAGILGVSMSWLLTGEGDGPEMTEESEALPAGILDLLAEVRGLRNEILQSGEKLGRLEKRLRSLLKDTV